MSQPNGQCGTWHYDDLSCCHTAVPHAMQHRVIELLTDLAANDYPNGDEAADHQARAQALLKELPEPWPHVTATGCALTQEDFGPGDPACVDGGLPFEHPRRGEVR